MNILRSMQGLIGKNLESINDDDEKIIHDKFNTLFHEFDSFLEFANLEIDTQREEAYKIEITSTNDGSLGAVIRLTKEQEYESKDIEQKIKNSMSPNKKLNQIALINILKEEIKNEKS